MPVHADIDDLLRAAAAAVSADRPGAERIGTAFRVTPDYAVTAAHVAHAAGGRVRLVFGEDSACTADVVVASPPPAQGSRWGFDDLAVLRIDQPSRVGAPCVLMAEPVLTAKDELLVCALNPTYVDRVTEIYHGYRVRDMHQRFFTIDGDRSVIQGMSGAPVWSVPHGGVVGFVKASENLDSAQGGAIAYLLDGLRVGARTLYDEIVTAHDAYHHADHTWVDRLVGAEAPVRRWLVELQGLLAEIATAAERRVPVGLVDELFRDSFLPDMGDLLTLRDLAEYLGTESQNPTFDLARFCALAPKHLPVDPAVAQGLRELPKKMLLPRDYPQFERRFLSTQQDSTEVTVLFGIIVPEEGPRLDERAPIPHRYELARKSGDQEIITLEPAGRCASYDHAKRELKYALDVALSTIEKPRDAVEIVVALPDDRLGEDPLFEWRRTDERPFSKFRMRLRRSSTWEKSSEQIAELDARWNRLRSQGADSLVWLGCADPRARALPTLQGLFADADPPDGVAVTEPPTAEVLTASASNALPITLWRTEGCPTHPGEAPECDGSVFRTALAARLAPHPPTDWYSAIWHEQREHEHSEERDLFWRKIVCVLDVPGQSRRRPPPLAGPGAMRREWL
ncbi:hypothetical protein GV794_25755 [Nocardia cyriacigeorgica]|uniref:vWA-MoxR associated protein C-terminal domain-containing protein n=1 Tax=Nocardia cyriacigeorgica TaxID=135487 RepID=A0A6P1DFM6_9NOCA|nr:trypsin-like peptidase domain-containing protein [Nocardia cyriacigeorgica]NEW47383.1 hypothetical protein [Nocardia cyriacigeorgica]NEW59019.1 hypothetical protein [Nocardia cyriacigeorgica]